MAHWIIEDKGFGGSWYECSECHASYCDLYDNAAGGERCPKCSADMDLDSNEYVDEKEKVSNKLQKLADAIGKITIPNFNIKPFDVSAFEGHIQDAKERDERIHRLEMTSGMTLDDILEKFAAGYVLVPTRMVGAKFDEELCKRHGEDSIDVLRYYPRIFDMRDLQKQGIVKLNFTDDIEINFDEKMGERSDSMLNEEKPED